MLFSFFKQIEQQQQQKWESQNGLETCDLKSMLTNKVKSNIYLLIMLAC